ncbi:hypothetical protein E3P89_03698 [Wallemia ichthyophaga]|uniref:Transcription factor domain-containing protein n=1 Tax=Wallemia ichthyophaga TaxID=245174 RepID=A0A4T0G9P9_WALIC|nr:hypothetical protein E3P96_03323 [Wallemia ichthyophaga]TIB07814.1 hypothetical protein E3P93_03731 [Wallemia ichthyophaga]TIB08315.1 hypothetical protein E3P90_03729 [Wallemia ichthyophaga]TIB19736.1 hypothetical protein E3P89_03698 [Wallemia ichthyophaga]TIB20923.1 hypothetical protein E3P88_03726 [Wallemia ichthyophaga]
MTTTRQLDQEEVILAGRLNEVDQVVEAIDEFGIHALLTARDDRSNSILHMLSANNHLELLKRVIGGCGGCKDALAATLLHQNQSKSTALHWAATNGNKELAIYLCEQARDVGDDTEHKLTFSTNQSGLSAASEAERGGHDDLVVELLARMDALDKGSRGGDGEGAEGAQEPLSQPEDSQPENPQEDVVVQPDSYSFSIFIDFVSAGSSPLAFDYQTSMDHNKKRKRLTKACDNCHKVGGLLISTLFLQLCRTNAAAMGSSRVQIGKQCSYSDNNGHSIPPPKSRSEKEHESHLKIKTEYNLFSSDLHGENSKAVLNDPLLKKELVLLFLDHMYPFNLIFHKPSLLYALEKDRLTPMLLNSIFALSARLSPHPRFQHIEPWKTGVDFAAIARRILFDPDDLGACALDDSKLEVVQTSLLLAAHDFGIGLFNRAYTYLGIAISQLKILGLNHDDFVTPAPENTREKWISREERRRTGWCVIMLDSVAAAINGRAKPFEEHDLKMFLPSDDVAFELAVGNVGNREFINTPPSTDNATTEFGYLIRIVNVFSNVMGYIYFHEKERMANASQRSTNTTTQSPYSSHSCKQDLAQWSQSLPPHLELSSINLNLAMMSMQAGANSSGWCYALMHAFAECSVFYLHSTVEQGASEESMRTSADRQNQSVGNMRAVIDALGRSGRKSPLLIYFVYVVSKWQLHVQGALDAVVADIWDEELAELWRMDKTLLTGDGNSPPVLEEEGSENENESESDKAHDTHSTHAHTNTHTNTMETIAKLLENANQPAATLNTSVNPVDLNLLPSRNLLLSPSLPDLFAPSTTTSTPSDQQQQHTQENARTIDQLAQRSKIIANASPTPTTPPIRLATLRSSSDISNWAVGCDGDMGGRSRAQLEYVGGVNVSGGEEKHAKFSGVLDPYVPEQWKKTLEDGVKAKSGYAGLRTKTRTTLFGTACWDLSLHPYLAMRVRNNMAKGGGASSGSVSNSSGYFINIQTEGAVRSDLFQHRLFTPPNSHWHTLVVPLSSFVLTNAGETSDQQLPMLREKIRTVGISLLANPDGNSTGRVENSERFDLDIEWIEAWNDSNPDVVARQSQDGNDNEKKESL